MSDKMTVEEIKELLSESEVIGTDAYKQDMLENIVRLADTALALYHELDICKEWIPNLLNTKHDLETDNARLLRYEKAWKMITEQGLMAKSDEDIVIRYAGIEEDA